MKNPVIYVTQGRDISNRALHEVHGCVGCGPNMPDATVHSDARVMEHVNGPLYRVSLPNGKEILAHLSKRLADSGEVFECDEILRVELTPYDFDQARILGRL